MSDINEYLNDVKEEIETSSSDSRSQAIENGMLNLRGGIRKMNLRTESEVEPVQEQTVEHDKIELADRAVNVYRTNIQEKKEKVEKPLTKAQRVDTRSRIQSLSGNSGKYAPTLPSGAGNTGGIVSGNITIPPLSMEEYKEQVFASFGLDEACWKGYEKKGMKKMFGKMYPNCVKKTAKKEEVEFVEGKDPVSHALDADKKQAKLIKDTDKDVERVRKGGKFNYKEDVVEDLENVLLELDDTSWQSIDKAMRKLCREHNMTPKELHKEFKSRHGMIPDEWIKEQTVVEECGWIPLDEVTRVNRNGQVYDVTFIFRGGTSRFKFFWPTMTRPSKKEMQAAVEKFYPRARLIAYYPCMKSNDDNMMIIVPPMTENYEIIPEDTWAEMPEELNEIYHQICEEVGEPISFPMDNDDEDIVLYVEDHDTGEEREVIIEGGLHAWFSKSKSKDGKPGWVQSDGSPCANEKGETKVPKCYSSQRLAALKRSKRGKNLIKAADARKRREDPGQQSKSGAAKPTMVKTFAKASDKKKYKSGDSSIKDESFDPTLTEGKGMEGMTQKGGHKRSTESGAGLTQKGVEKYRRQNPGSKLQTAVTTPPSKLKPGSKAAKRRKSFCARSRGWTGERGKAARRRWNC